MADNGMKMNQKIKVIINHNLLWTKDECNNKRKK